MSLKKVFSDFVQSVQNTAKTVVEKTCRENVAGALILSALAVFGFARTASALSEISGKPTTTDTVSMISREQVEKIAKPDVSAETTEVATSFRSATPAASRAAAATGSSAAASSAGSFITIAGASIPLVSVRNTATNPGNNAASYGHLLYGHRGTAFGNIANLPAGAQFTITRNGATENYVVADSVTLDKDTTANFMYSLVNQASYKGKTYSLVLMTCAGAPGDNGDASHRTIVFANRA